MKTKLLSGEGASLALEQLREWLGEQGHRTTGPKAMLPARAEKVTAGEDI